MKMISLTMNQVAQGLHAALGALCVALPGWLFGNRAAVIGGALAILFAAVKEGWWDKKYETPETAGSGWEDFAFWVMGVAIAGTLGATKSLTF